MKYQRHVAVIGLIAASALVLSACGSDDERRRRRGAPRHPGVDCGGKTDLRSSGSSAQKNAMTRFVATYQQTCAGPDPGLQRRAAPARASSEFPAARPTSAARTPRCKDRRRDRPAPRSAARNPAWNLPLVFGPVAIAYNVAGVTDLVLDGATAAKIFNGQITTWNDPAIAALNQGKQLPAAPIVVIFRSDESGTTDNFQKYLVAASKGAWTKDAGKKFNGGVGDGAQRQPGCRRRHQEHPELDHLRRVVVRPGQQARASPRSINAGGGSRSS